MVITKNTYLKKLKRLSAGLSAMLTIKKLSAVQTQLLDSIMTLQSIVTVF